MRRLLATAWIVGLVFLLVSSAAAPGALAENDDAAAAGEPDAADDAPSLEQRIAQWIAQLSSSSYVQRDRAQRALRRAGAVAVEPLKDALREARDAETIFRLQSLLVEIDDDFLTLVAALDDHNRHVRRYAEEALLLRFYDPAQEADPRQDPFRWNPGDQTAPRRLNQIRLGLDQDLEVSPYELLQIVRRDVPIIATADVYENPALLHSTHTFQARQLVNAETAVVAIADVLGLRVHQMRIGATFCVGLMQTGAEAQQITSNRDAILALCRLVLHDIEQARRDAFTEIGRLFASRPAVMTLITSALEREGNPLLDKLVRAVVLSEAPARESLGPLAPELAEVVASLLLPDQLWPVRQAAAQAVVTWHPEDAPPPQQDAYREYVLPLLEAEVAAEDAVRRYLAVWMIGALRPHWLKLQAEADDPDSDANADNGEAAPPAGAQLPEDVPAQPPDALREALVAALEDNVDVARMALYALSHLRVTDAQAVEHALELGFAAETDQVKDAVLGYLRLVGTADLYAEVIERYDPQAHRTARIFSAELLAGARRDNETRLALLDTLVMETDPQVGARMLPAFTESFRDRRAWEKLEAMLADESHVVRRYAREVIVRSGLAERQQRIREMLDTIAAQLLEKAPALADAQAQQATLREQLRELANDTDDDDDTDDVREAQLRDALREVRNELETLEQARIDLLTDQVHLHLVLLRLGEDGSLGEVREAIVGGQHAQVAREAALGLGEAGHDNAVSIFEEAFASGRENSQLAAIHGVDAMARISSQAGDQALVRRLFTATHRFNRPQTAAVQELLNTVRSRFWNNDGYNDIARRQAERLAEQTGSRYPARPPTPEPLLR